MSPVELTFPDVETLETAHVVPQSPTRPPTREEPDTVAFVTVMLCNVLLPVVRPASVPTYPADEVAENPSSVMLRTVAPAIRANNPQ